VLSFSSTTSDAPGLRASIARDVARPTMPPPMTTTSARNMGAVRYHGPCMTTQQIFARASTRLRLVWAALTFAYLLFAGVMLAASHAQSRPLDVGTEGAFIVMAITGLLTGALILFGIKATGRSLEAAGYSSAS